VARCKQCQKAGQAMPKAPIIGAFVLFNGLFVGAAQARQRCAGRFAGCMRPKRARRARRARAGTV